MKYKNYVQFKEKVLIYSSIEIISAIGNNCLWEGKVVTTCLQFQLQAQ